MAVESKSVTEEDLMLIAWIAERAAMYARNAIGQYANGDDSWASRSAAEAALLATQAADIAYRLAKSE